MLRVYGGSVFFNPLRGAEVRRPLLLFISIALTISGESFTVDVCGQGDIYLYIYIKKECVMFLIQKSLFFFFAERQLTAVNLEVSMADVYGSFSGR